ncbi:MAG: acetylxylan esterase [Bacteroidaceae bacterium]|nr:acetylxylan esterase [Bacteroidaceae bacterium]
MKKLFILSLFAFASALGAHAQNSSWSASSAGENNVYFNKVEKNSSSTPDENGFIRRWSLLEPILWPNRSNTVFTDSYLRETFCSKLTSSKKKPLVLPETPKDGQKTVVNDSLKLKWHVLESTGYNVQLYRFATQRSLQRYGIILAAVTHVIAPEEMDVRLSVGSNSASMWWINGEEALILSGDRRMVVDDASALVHLKKGDNRINGYVINGPGMSNFCLRFLDKNNKPVTYLTIK